MAEKENPTTQGMIMFPKTHSEVQQYLLSLFRLNRGRYVALCQTDKARDPQADALIQTLVKHHDDASVPITIEDVFCFECALLQLEPIGKIRRMAWNVRATYRALAGSSQYDLYLKSDPPDPQGYGPIVGTAPRVLLTDAELAANEADLRTDMHMLTGEIFRALALIPQREQLRNSTARTIGLQLILFWILALLIGRGLVSGSSSAQSQLWVVFPVCIAGATGAFISVQRRLQNLPINNDSPLGFYALYFGRKSLILSPIAGMVFSGLLYLVFSGGLVNGDLFPKITSRLDATRYVNETGNTKKNTSGSPDTSLDKSENHPMSFSYFTKDAGPENSTAWAKLLVWSFLAGFAEQLVPDILNRITSRQAAIEKVKDVKTG